MRALDFSDDRLASVLDHLGQDEEWEGFEGSLDALDPNLKSELGREYERYQLVHQQFKAIEQEQRRRVQGRRHESNQADHRSDAIEGCWLAIELDFGNGIFRMEELQEPARVGCLRRACSHTIEGRGFFHGFREGKTLQFSAGHYLI
ncbi:MAG: hypothetical protein BECKG1743D_GA0114223_111681 [Candidatus Kentron sp. G]|nr:MAG: hypothetical protein BECKG1743F_GA0114225_111961 [Candidatus Kentron sp. G]VFN07055.1 MAG: hypothetical protein BECKG1743E_GA0114224_111231 [Candidatus Kentron sp. G]VFN07862.1 MAG: hypothetical protein BECKG1743D_GA0114223_111681 [Candidatus Kentron sp. G]